MNKAPGAPAKRLRQDEKATAQRPRNVRQAVGARPRTPAPASASLPTVPRPQRRDGQEEKQDENDGTRATLESDVRHCLRKVMQLSDQFQALSEKVSAVEGLPAQVTATFDTIEREIASLKTATAGRDPNAAGPVLPNLSNLTVSSATFTSNATALLIKDIVETWTVGMPKESVVDKVTLNPPYMTPLKYHHAFPALVAEDDVLEPLKQALIEKMSLPAAKELDVAFATSYKLKQTKKRIKGRPAKIGPDGVEIEPAVEPKVETSGVEGVHQGYLRERRQAKNDRIGRQAKLYVQKAGLGPLATPSSWRLEVDEEEDALGCFFFKNEGAAALFDGVFSNDAEGLCDRRVLSVYQLASLDEAINTRASGQTPSKAKVSLGKDQAIATIAAVIAEDVSRQMNGKDSELDIDDEDQLHPCSCCFLVDLHKWPSENIRKDRVRNSGQGHGQNTEEIRAPAVDRQERPDGMKGVVQQVADVEDDGGMEDEGVVDGLEDEDAEEDGGAAEDCGAAEDGGAAEDEYVDEDEDVAEVEEAAEDEELAAEDGEAAGDEDVAGDDDAAGEEDADGGDDHDSGLDDEEDLMPGAQATDRRLLSARARSVTRTPSPRVAKICEIVPQETVRPQRKKAVKTRILSLADMVAPKATEKPRKTGKRGKSSSPAKGSAAKKGVAQKNVRSGRLVRG